MDDRKVISAFESIGYNCEFGLVQQLLGYNPISLLRFAGCPLDGLVRALEADFAGLFRREDVRPRLPGALYDAKYDFFYNVDLAFDGENLLDSEANLSRHRRLLRDVSFRLRLFRETLAGRQKILVFKSQAPLMMIDLLRLKSALDLHGPQRLLYIVEATRDRPPGTVQRIAAGLKVASLAKLADNLSDPPNQIDTQAWLRVCNAALAGDWGHGWVPAAGERDPPQKAAQQDGWNRALQRMMS